MSRLWASVIVGRSYVVKNKKNMKHVVWKQSVPVPRNLRPTLSLITWQVNPRLTDRNAMCGRSERKLGIWHDRPHKQYTATGVRSQCCTEESRIKFHRIVMFVHLACLTALPTRRIFGYISYIPHFKHIVWCHQFPSPRHFELLTAVVNPRPRPCSPCLVLDRRKTTRCACSERSGLEDTWEYTVEKMFRNED